MRENKRLDIINSKTELDKFEKDKVFGIVEYGDKKRFENIEGYEDIPYIFINMNNLNGNSNLEVWHSSERVEHKEYENIKYSVDNELLFVGISRVGNKNYEEVGRKIYNDIFFILIKENKVNILRIWNYISQINAPGLKEENYKEFCIGRESAFDKYYLENKKVLYPAATGIGCEGDDLTIYLMAQKDNSNIINIENPRQVPAYDYPIRYGCASPRFSRASYIKHVGKDNIYISGTASIIGCETKYVGDIEGQCKLTIENIEKLITKENLEKYDINDNYTLKDINVIKVYIRYENDYEKVKSICEKAFSKEVKCMYFIADICRSDLLVEIEGVI